MIKNTISHMLKRISGKVSSETSMIEISLKMSNGDNEAPAQVSIRMYNKDDKSFELIKESFSCDIDGMEVSIGLIRTLCDFPGISNCDKATTVDKDTDTVEIFYLFEYEKSDRN